MQEDWLANNSWEQKMKKKKNNGAPEKLRFFSIPPVINTRAVKREEESTEMWTVSKCSEPNGIMKGHVGEWISESLSY